MPKGALPRASGLIAIAIGLSSTQHTLAPVGSVGAAAGFKTLKPQMAECALPGCVMGPVDFSCSILIGYSLHNTYIVEVISVIQPFTVTSSCAVTPPSLQSRTHPCSWREFHFQATCWRSDAQQVFFR